MQSTGHVSQVSLAPDAAYLVTKGCLSDWCGFFCKSSSFSSSIVKLLLTFFFKPDLLSPLPIPALAFFLDLEYFGF